MKKTYFAILAIGRDTPGIVAAISGVLLNHSCEVEVSQMTIIGGHFAATLIASSVDEPDPEELAAALEAAGEASAVQGVYVSELDAGDYYPGGRRPSYSVIVRANERPALLFDISKVLAEHNVNITTLASVRSPEDESLWSIAFDVALPGELSEEDLRTFLRNALGNKVVIDIDSAPQEINRPI